MVFKEIYLDYCFVMDFFLVLLCWNLVYMFSKFCCFYSVF